jgi:hypothetical protein
VWANSALVVNIAPEDMVDFGGDGPLRGVYWQQVRRGVTDLSW